MIDWDNFDFEECHQYVIDNKGATGRRYLVDEYCESKGIVVTPDEYQKLVKIVYSMVDEDES